MSTTRFAVPILVALIAGCPSAGTLERASSEEQCLPLPASDDLDPRGCDESLSEVWRCALSESAWRDAQGNPYSISQVCRRAPGGGWAWRTFTLFPSDCAACVGRDRMIPDGCEASPGARAPLPACAPGAPEDRVVDELPAGEPEERVDENPDEWVDEEPEPEEDQEAPDEWQEPEQEQPEIEPGELEPGVVSTDGIAAYDALGAQELAELSMRRLFWGHQSVGENLIQGSSSLGFPWQEAGQASDFEDETTWGHGWIGENGDPYGKVRSFVSFMEDAGLADAVDAASFKLCWIDFEQGTNVEGLLDTTLAAVAGVEAGHPGLRILLVTPPLTTDEPGLNAIRWEYGRRLIERSSQDHVVLDLAAVISTDSRGQACTSGGARRLCDEWASDNGHLTAAGSERAAKAFLYAFSRLF